MRSLNGLANAGVLLMVLLGSGCRDGSDAQDAGLSVPKLPGGDDLKTRMASHYQPVSGDCPAAAPQYQLPLDFGRVTNAAQAKSLVAGEAARLLRQNGFAATAPEEHDDLVAFYEALKKQGVPIFVTSDSVLHLYHLQFDETLKDIEERQLFDDALQMSLALQTEAERLRGELAGEAKEAARRLVAYATVAVELLAADTLRPQAVEARKEVAAWPDPGGMRQVMEFAQKHPELLGALTAAKSGPPGLPRMPGMPGMPRDKASLLSALEAYLKGHPGGKLVEAPVPAAVADDVRQELALIAEHAGFSKSPLFDYDEDYSQYLPRGHYTRSEKLKRYFKALMWYGRMTFLIKGRKPGEGASDALVSEAEARVQTKAAVLLASLLDSAKLADGRTVAEAWDRLYAVTAYYVGLADDLTPYEYRGAVRKAIGETLRAADLEDGKKWFALRRELALLRPPEIYSGTGNIEAPPTSVTTEADLDKALENTKGLRLMGQRYVPDSFMMGRLVYPTVGDHLGTGQPFTLSPSPAGPVRGFPRGLDIAAVLGSRRARELLRQLGDDQYARYDETLAKLQEPFGKVTPAEWNRNLYWSWLYALKALLTKAPAGAPTFMQTEAWQDKQLHAMLGSWAQLRHDTILYAKQSYTMVGTAMPPRPKMIEGYVEPVPELYARLLALTRMTRRGLTEMEVLSRQAQNRLANLERIVERLLVISKQELSGKALSTDDYNFIRSFGGQLKGAVAGVAEEGLETTIVADVHTDGNTQSVLEEGTGFLRRLCVAYPMPDGGVVVGAGPAFSYYEFKQPMDQRLTDEAWKAMLRAQPPAEPEWVGSFCVETDK